MSPGPRSTSGTAVCSAMPLRPLAASARPSQPVAELVGPRAARFEQLLRVEVRPFAVRQAGGVHHQQFAAAVQRVHLGQRRVQRKRTLERQRRGERAAPADRARR